MEHRLQSEKPAHRMPSRQLLDEIERYLDTVALFRALGHEPVWRCEDGRGIVVDRIARYSNAHEPRVSPA